MSIGYDVREFLWVEKYRPRKIEDVILPSELKEVFQKFVDNRVVPNLILSGPAGTGKTTIARVMLEQLGSNYIVINGSMNGNIDTLRNEIKAFASTVSLTGGRKYVILDEADYLNANSTQPALRNFMEEFSKNCGFILTCNFKNRIIEPLHSRCAVIEFKISKKDSSKLAMQFMKRIEAILDNEKIAFDRAVIAEVIKKHFPDWRRVLNELQRYASTGKIDSGILSNFQKSSFKELASLMKDKNFSEIRAWVKNNSDIDSYQVFNEFYDSCSEYFTKQSIPELILLIARYQYQNAFAANPEINLLAFIVEAMLTLEFV